MDVTSSGAVSARLALGVTTVALVALASAGTAVVVSTGSSAVYLGSLPPQLSLPVGVSRSGAIVVGAPPGRAWPSDAHPVQRSVGAGANTVVPVRRLNGLAVRGAVSTSFTDGLPPLPTPLALIAPAARPPVADPPIQTPVDNPPVPGPPADQPPIQRPPTDAPAPVTDPTGPPATGGQPAPAPAPPAPSGPAAGGNPVTLPVVAGTPGRPSTRGDQPPSPTAERPTVQPSVVITPAAARPAKSTNGGHDAGHAQAQDDRHGGQAGGPHPGDDTGKGPGDDTDPRSDSHGDQHGRGGGGDQHGRGGGGDDQSGHGHGNRPS